MKLNKLLSPGKIGTLELKNRFVVPPMGTNFATYDGMVTDEMIAYLCTRGRDQKICCISRALKVHETTARAGTYDMPAFIRVNSLPP